MVIQLRCDRAGCGALLQGPDSAAGQKTRCPRCGEALTWPGAVSEAVTTHPTREAPREEIVTHLGEGRYTKDRPRPRSPLAKEPEGELRCPYCRQDVGPAEQTCPACDRNLGLADVGAHLAWLLRQRRWNLRLTLAFGALCLGGGIALILLESVGVTMHDEPLLAAVGFLSLFSFWVAVGCGVSYKRDNILWMFVVLFNIPGLVLLFLLRDQKGRRVARMRRFIANHPAAREP
jgi:hypothetical protein